MHHVFPLVTCYEMIVACGIITTSIPPFKDIPSADFRFE